MVRFISACGAAISAASASFRTGGRVENTWESQLDLLLSDGVQPSLRSGQELDPADASRVPGWYEMTDDPWNVRWWSGREWIGQPIPLTASMLAL